MSAKAAGAGRLRFAAPGYRCEGRYHRGLVFQNVSLLTEFGALAAVLMVGWGPISAAVSMVVVNWLAALVMRTPLDALALHAEADHDRAGGE